MSIWTVGSGTLAPVLGT